VDELIRASLLHARKHPEESAEYIKGHAQELEDAVIRQHIELYVNEFSEDLGDEGTRAVQEFLRRAEEKNIIESSSMPLFAD
jgi:1,4-dihydroxy-6-naphthoate synthase